MKKLICIELFVLVVGLADCGGWVTEADLENTQTRVTDTIKDIKTSGHCLVEPNRKPMQRTNIEFAKHVESCVRISGFSAVLDVDCVKQKYTEMTDSCLDCFAKLTKCTADNCGLGTCDSFVGQGPYSRECYDCSVAKCHVEMYTCSGLKKDDIPSLYQS